MGIVERLKTEFDIADEWLPFEIHPDTPLGGVRWEDYFQGMDSVAFFKQLDRQGEPLGVRFNSQPIMSNSSLAMQEGEIARKSGHHKRYHEAVFEAFFTKCLDIGDQQIITDIINLLGLDPQALDAELKAGTYMSVLSKTKKQASARMVTAAPTFFIEGGPQITGAQPLEQFRETLRNLQQVAGD
mgnify:CR=1 FL=1